MAEKSKEPPKGKEEKAQAKTVAKPTEKEKKHVPTHEEINEVLIRIFGYDVPGSKNIYSGLTRIKGVSWAISNAICLKLELPREKKVSQLTKDEIAKIESFLKDMPIPNFMKNRRFDIETGETSHILGSDLDIAREFDIKRLKKIKSYRGFRHSYGQPSRGQRTKSHFRSKGRGVGVKRKTK